MAAHLRNETEGARPVATFGDLDEGIVARRGQHARRRFVVQISCALISKGDDWKRTCVRLRITNGEDVVYLAGTDKGIDFRQRRFQLITIAFDETAGDHKPRGFAV